MKSLSSVCTSVFPSVPSVTKFSRDWVLVFSDIVHNDSNMISRYLQGQILKKKKKIDGSNLDQMGQDWAQN